MNIFLLQSSNTLAGVIVAKPSVMSPGSAAPMIRSTSGPNLIFKGKIPLVLEKSKTTSNNSAMTTTSTDNIPVSPSKVPNILRGTNSPSKNTIDRQIVSHEATIEFRKNIFSRPIPAPNNTIVSNTTTTTSSKDTVSSLINGKLQKSTEINNISKDSQKIS